jgi:hypothetical protein
MIFILRLEPPIEMDTPKGRGLAILFRDYGHDTDDMWTVVGARELAEDQVRQHSRRGDARGEAGLTRRRGKRRRQAFAVG